ncbi:hypothetical protein [Delftia acidovorans]|uniref:Uncharacterized protein n=1 Tax=Delftia acidovorans TaxID=80866 RepID=A0AAJ2R506_DELAC|nr:hypothetical protein [Delftia acidovorans]MDX4955918.1 hypothetical protein [Delftia acidovorans]
MTTAPTPQPEALRLAAWLNEGAWHQMRLGDVEAAGRELKRLHAENERLRGDFALRGAQIERMAALIDELEARKPLPPARVDELMAEAGYLGASAESRADFINGLRHGEAVHGITGGSS